MPTVVSPRAGRSDWFHAGSCRHSGLHPDAWFPISADSEEAREAKAICGYCPVALRCRSEAARFHNVAGIWAGQDEEDRRAERRRRKARS